MSLQQKTGIYDAGSLIFPMTQHPLFTNKSKLVELLGLTNTKALRKKVFTDDVLEQMGWTYEKNYRTARDFDIMETKLIFETLSKLGFKWTNEQKHKNMVL